MNFNLIFGLLSKPLVRDIVGQAIEMLSLESSKKGPHDSCLHMMARIIDLVHPTHALQAQILSSTIGGLNTMKKHLTSLGYNVSNSVLSNAGIAVPATNAHGEPNSQTDPHLGHYCEPKLGLFICKALMHNVEKEMRFYFEFSVTDNVEWRVGLVSAKRGNFNEYATYPGFYCKSMGFGSDGFVYYQGSRKAHFKIDKEHFSIGHRTFGIIVDVGRGSISFVLNGGAECQPTFGFNSFLYSEFERAEQMRVNLY